MFNKLFNKMMGNAPDTEVDDAETAMIKLLDELPNLDDAALASGLSDAQSADEPDQELIDAIEAEIKGRADTRADEINALLGQNVGDVTSSLASLENPTATELQEILDAENGSSKPRKGVVDAINALLTDIADDAAEKGEPALSGARNLSEGDAEATDHSDAVPMRFLRKDYFVTKFNTKIEGREGEDCALHPDDVEKAEADGMMERVE